MPNPRAFVSFDYDNNLGQKRFFLGQASNSKTPFNIEDWSSKSHLPQKQWESLIEAKIKKCHMLIVLVGKNMGTATGVAKEIAFARKNNIPVFGVYVDNANTRSILPTGLQRNRTIPWNWQSIASAISQVLTEGKNKIT